MVERNDRCGILVDLNFLVDVEAVTGAEGWRDDWMGRWEGELEGRG